MTTSLTDWDRLKNMTEEEIEKNASEDPDNPLLTDAELKKFKKIIPRKGGISKSVRVSFTGNKWLYANVYIGKDVIEKLKWESDGRVYVYCDDKNPKEWMLEKAEGKNDSFKLVSGLNQDGNVSKLQFRFSGYTPEKKEKKLKEVNYKIIGNKIIINNT